MRYKINKCEIKDEDRAYWKMFTDSELERMIKEKDKTNIRKALLDKQLSLVEQDVSTA